MLRLWLRLNRGMALRNLRNGAWTRALTGQPPPTELVESRSDLLAPKLIVAALADVLLREQISAPGELSDLGVADRAECKQLAGKASMNW